MLVGMGDITLEQRDAFAALREAEADTYHASIVDFPWEFDTDNGTDRFGHDQSTGESDLYETVTNEDMAEVLAEVARVVVDGGWVFLFADDEVYPLFREAVTAEESLERRQTVFWDSVSMGMGYYHRVQAYPLVTATVGETERYVQGRPNIYEAKQNGSSAEYHTQKPVDLYRQMCEPPVLAEGEHLLEPFCGTAPGKAVALERECKYTGWDVSEEALEIARERSGQSTLV